jgi:N-acetylmuramoyl-L-alanine amidase
MSLWIQFWRKVEELLQSSATTDHLRTIFGGKPLPSLSATTVSALPTFAGAVPVRPPSIKRYSPNQRYKAGRKITCVVLHATATTGVSSPLSWLCDAKSGVSAHYLIDVDGTIYGIVDEQSVAWHAGDSTWRGLANVNEFSVGIELVNANNGIMAYPEAQLAACARMVKAICSDHGIKPADVIGHADIAPGRKNDPLGFDWFGFRRRLA